MKAIDIARDIHGFYEEKQERAKIEKEIRSVIEEKVNETDELRMTIHGMNLQFKRRPRWKWNQRVIMEEAEDLGILHEIVSPSTKHEKEYDIAPYRLPVNQYAKPYPPTLPKDEKERLTQEQEEKTMLFLEELQKKNLNELVLMYRENNLTKKQLERDYKAKVTHLTSLMKKEELTAIYPDDDSEFCFKLTNEQAQYDALKILQSGIQKTMLFAFKRKANGEAEVIDCFRKNAFTLKTSLAYFSHTLTLRGEEISVDGVPLETLLPNKTTGLKKEEKQRFVKEGFLMAKGNVPYSGLAFLKTLDPVTKLIEEQIDKERFDHNTLEKWRYLESEEDITVVFEVIDEELDAQRRSVYYDRMMKRAQRHRKTQEHRKKMSS